MKKVALITGARGGIGSAITTALLAQGYRIIATHSSANGAAAHDWYGEEGGSVVEAGPFEGVLHPAKGNASTQIAARANVFRCMGADPFQSGKFGPFQQSSWRRSVGAPGERGTGRDPSVPRR